MSPGNSTRVFADTSFGLYAWAETSREMRAVNPSAAICVLPSAAVTPTSAVTKKRFLRAIHFCGPDTDSFAAAGSPAALREPPHPPEIPPTR